MFVEATKRVLAMPRLPTMIEVETADGILTTNQGYELAEAKRLLMISVSYVVKVRNARVADYGSISHRHRIVLVCILRDVPGANDFEVPAPTWGVQRTGVDKNMGLRGRPPYHLKSAQDRDLKRPFFFFFFLWAWWGIYIP